ncbi:MAG: 50S ribosomal protein L25 [Chloroflexota bacterium]|nr:50S ribosomal protein L25 [Chloroflexota bacterium]
MSQETTGLEVSRREAVGKKVRRLRKQGYIPAVLYGYGVEPTKLQVRVKEFEAAYKAAGRTALVDLSIENTRPVKVFVQEVQRHPISQAAQHIDFHAVNLRQELSTDVPVVLVGEAPAVRNNLGVLLHGVQTVTVHALPADLPQQLEASVEGLEEVDQAIHVSDLPSDGKFQILTDPTELIAKIAAQQLEPEVEEIAEVEAAAEGEAATEEAPSDTSDAE